MLLFTVVISFMHTGKYSMVNINAPALEPIVRVVSHGLVVSMIDKPSPSLVLHSLMVINGSRSDEIIREVFCPTQKNLNANIYLQWKSHLLLCHSLITH